MASAASGLRITSLTLCRRLGGGRAANLATSIGGDSRRGASMTVMMKRDHSSSSSNTSMKPKSIPAEGSKPNTREGVRPKGPRFIGQRGDSGRGWYQLYEEEGPEGFLRYRPPTPFDWEAASPEAKAKRRQAYLDVSLDNEKVGRIIIELADDVLPITAQNFALLCQGKRAEEGKKAFSYKGSSFHRIVKGAGIVGGSVANDSGLGNHSAYSTRFFADEAFIIPHTAPGLVSMVSSGVHRNASQFYITTEHCPHLNGRAVVFGRVIKGMEVVKKVSSTYSIRGRPVAAVSIDDAGLL